MTIFGVLSARIGLFAMRGATVGLNFVAMLVIAYLMGIAEYGRFVVVWASAQIASSLLSQGLPVYLLREFAVREKLGDNGVSRGLLVWRALVLPMLICLGAFLSAEGVAQFWSELPLDLVPMILAMAFLLNLNTLFSSAFHAFGWQSLSMFQRDALPQTLALVAAAVTAASGRPDAPLVIILTLILLILWVLLALAVAWHGARGRALLGTGAQPPGRLSSFWGSAVLGTALAQVDIVVGSLFLTPAELGVYNILRRVANLAVLPATIASWATVGDFSRAFAAKDRDAIEQANRKALILAVPPGLMLVFLSIPLYPALSLIYELPRLDMLFATYLVLLGQSAIVVFFGAGVTICTSSGMERVALQARLIALSVYLAGLAGLQAIATLSVFGNAVAILLAMTSMGGFVWWRIQAAFGFDSSGFAIARGVG